MILRGGVRNSKSQQHQRISSISAAAESAKSAESSKSAESVKSASQKVIGATYISDVVFRDCTHFESN